MSGEEDVMASSHSSSPAGLPRPRSKAASPGLRWRTSGTPPPSPGSCSTSSGSPSELSELSDSAASDSALLDEDNCGLWVTTLNLGEDADAHLRWEEALAGRCIAGLSLDELRPLVRGHGGAPHKHRLSFWPRCFGASASDGPLRSGVPEAVRNQIELDVPRTQPQWFSDTERGALRTVLCSFAALNPEVGYCQGLNNVAAVFVLLGFDEETALRGLDALTRKVCPGYHGPDLAGYRRDARVLEALAKRTCPGLAERLAALEVPLEVLAADHFLTLSARRWPLRATARLWDLLFLEGQPALFASFLALLDLYLPSVQGDQVVPDMSVEDDLEPMEIFRWACQRALVQELGAVVDRTCALIPSVPQSLIDSLRAELAV